MKGCLCFIIIAISSCVNSGNNARDCGRAPSIPYWEYTGPFGGGGSSNVIHVPLPLFEQDLEWRKDMATWAECVSGERPLQCLNGDCSKFD